MAAKAKVQRHYTRSERRRLERDLDHHKWGFSGKSPNTTKRKYKGGR